MKRYIYNTSNIEFYLEDDTDVHVDQIEDSPSFIVELFPKNQSEDSFNDAEFSTIFSMSKFQVDNELDIEDLETPSNWTVEQYREFKATLIQQLNEIKLDKVEVLCDNCGKPITGTIHEVGCLYGSGKVMSCCDECAEDVRIREALKSNVSSQSCVYIVKQEDERQTEETIEALPLDVIDELAEEMITRDKFMERAWREYNGVIYDKDYFKVKVILGKVVKVWR